MFLTVFQMKNNQNHLVSGKNILKNNEYWFEKSDWVHGGEADAPDLGEACSDLLVIRVAESGKDHTVFID